MSLVDTTAAGRLSGGLRVVLEQAQDLVAAHDTGPRLAERVEVALAIANELTRVLGVDDRPQYADERVQAQQMAAGLEALLHDIRSSTE